MRNILDFFLDVLGIFLKDIFGGMFWRNLWKEFLGEIFGRSFLGEFFGRNFLGGIDLFVKILVFVKILSKSTRKEGGRI